MLTTDDIYNTLSSCSSKTSVELFDELHQGRSRVDKFLGMFSFYDNLNSLVDQGLIRREVIYDDSFYGKQIQYRRSW